MTAPAQVLAAVRSIPHPRQEPDMTAPEPSPAEQAAIDRFGMFDEEETIERVVDALYGVKWPDGEPYLHMARVHARKLATAALTELRGDRG